MHDAVSVTRGLQLLSTHHFSHQIKYAALQASEATVVHYAVGSDHVTAVCPIKVHKPQTKYTLAVGISLLLHVKKIRLYIVFCLDLTLRVYNEHFELLQTVSASTTILSLAYNESLSELYTGGIGCIKSWDLRLKLHSPLVPGKEFACSVDDSQWIVSLDYDVCSEYLVAACQDTIYVFNTHSHKQVDAFSGGHTASITSAILYPPMDFLISGSKAGSIKVWNCILHTEVHTFHGHLKAITGLKVHPLAPCIISCSMDGTVRMWHMESMAECFRVDCGEELLGLSTDFPLGCRMTCYSNRNVRTWTLTQLETHFASVNSDIVRMQRVEGGSRSKPARIVALAQDGGVRLLSPVTGQLMSILLPMFPSQNLCDVVCSVRDGLLFALLVTGEVLVFSMETNPCSATALWRPRNKDRITCLALCSIAAHRDCNCSKDGHISLVFGGQESGHISLLHGSRCVSIPHPSPAHAGYVIKLFASSTIVDLESTTPHPILVSYGTDEMLNIWKMEVCNGKNWNHKTTTVFRLKLHMSISLSACPIHVGIVQSTLCLALGDNRIVGVMVPVDGVQESLPLTATCVLTHQPEDDHTQSVSSLSCCSHLKLFATSSRDGKVRVWSVQNQLVSEIHFGDSLMSVCFANARGDLLVGFHKHISVLYAENYLPATLLEIVRACPYHDCMDEVPTPFDPDLEFWYDPGRVPLLPAHQHSRGTLLARKLPHGSTSNVPTQQSPITPQPCITGEDGNLHPRASGLVDPELTCRLSQDCSASMVRKKMPSPLEPSVTTNSSGACNPATASRQTQVVLPSIIIDGCSEVPSLGCAAEVNPLDSSPSLGICAAEVNPLDSSPSLGTCAAEVNPSSPRLGICAAEVNPLDSSPSLGICAAEVNPLDSSPSLRCAAEVTPLDSVSSKYPIAPDCLIPNSTLRTQLGYIPPIVEIPLEKLGGAMTVGKTQKKSKIKGEGQQKMELASEESYDEVERSKSDDEDITTCVSEFLELSPRSGASSSEVLQSSSEESQLSQDLSSSLNQSKTSAYNDTTSAPPANTQEQRTPIEDLCDTDDPVPTETSPCSDTAARDTAFAKSPSKNLQSEESTITQKVLPLKAARLPVQVYPPPAELQGTGAIPLQTSYHSKCSSGASSRSMERGRSESTSPLKTRSNTKLKSHVDHNVGLKLDEVSQLITRITTYQWFPKKKPAGSMEAVTETLVSMLKTSHMPIFGEVCHTLSEINVLSLMSADQQLSTLQHLLSRMKSRARKLRITALKMMEQLGIGGSEVMTAVLPALVDADMEIRNAAFKALKSVTGVTSRAQLHQLFIDMGLLQHVTADEDKTLKDLAIRLQGNHRESKSVSQLLESTVSTSAKDEATQRQTQQGHGSQWKTDGKEIGDTSEQGQQRHHQTITSGISDTVKAGSKPIPNKESPLALCQDYRLPAPAQTGGLAPAQTYGLAQDLYPQHRGLVTKDTLPSEWLRMFPRHPPTCRHTHNSVASAVSGSCNNGKAASGVMNGGGTRTITRGFPLQSLLVRHPNSFAQLKPVRQMMLRAYGNDKPTSGEAYAWSEVFPLVRVAKKLRDQSNRQRKRSQSLPAGRHTLPELHKDSEAVGDANCSGTSTGDWSSKQHSVVVTLPPIIFNS